MTIKVFTLIFLTFIIGGCISVEPEYETWPEDTRAQVHVDLGRIYLERGQIQVAKEEFNKARKIDPDSDQALHGLGLIEAQVLNYAKAKSLMSKAVSINNSNLSAVGDYAILICQTEDPARGISLLQRTQSKSKKPDTAGMFLALGRCHQAAKQQMAAEKAFSRVLQLNPKLPQALFSMAQIRYQQGESLSARAFIQRYFSTGASSSKALLLGAQIEQLMGNKAGRVGYTKKLKARYPQSEAWRQAQEIFN